MMQGGQIFSLLMEPQRRPCIDNIIKTFHHFHQMVSLKMSQMDQK